MIILFLCLSSSPFVLQGDSSSSTLLYYNLIHTHTHRVFTSTIIYTNIHAHILIIISKLHTQNLKIYPRLFIHQQVHFSLCMNIFISFLSFNQIGSWCMNKHLYIFCLYSLICLCSQFCYSWFCGLFFFGSYGFYIFLQGMNWDIILSKANNYALCNLSL